MWAQNNGIKEQKMTSNLGNAFDAEEEAKQWLFSNGHLIIDMDVLFNELCEAFLNRLNPEPRTKAK